MVYGTVYVFMQTCQVIQALDCSPFLCVSDVLDVKADGHGRGPVPVGPR